MYTETCITRTPAHKKGKLPEARVEGKHRPRFTNEAKLNGKADMLIWAPRMIYGSLWSTHQDLV